MIPEPAPAQQQLDAWVVEDFTRECCAIACAADALLEHTQSPANTKEATWALHAMLAQHANIGQHFGWPNWFAVCAHAQSLLLRCATDEPVRRWIRTLFHVSPEDVPTHDLLDSCPVPPVLGTSWQAEPLSVSQEPPAPPPWQQQTTDFSDAKPLRVTPGPRKEVALAPAPKAAPAEVLEDAQQEQATPESTSTETKLPETTSQEAIAPDDILIESDSTKTASGESNADGPIPFESKLAEASSPELHSFETASPGTTLPGVTTLVVFRASDQLKAIPAHLVASVVRKSQVPPQDVGACMTSESGCDSRAHWESQETLPTAPAAPGASRFEIVLEASAASEPILAQACFGVHTSPVMPVPDTTVASRITGVALIPGVGAAVVYDLDDHMPGTAQPPREPTE